MEAAGCEVIRGAPTTLRLKGQTDRQTERAKFGSQSVETYMLESKEMAEQIYWRAKQPSQAACVSEDLTC